jgi:tRNA(Glu) U13 pseudouridine synthase TruD
MLKGLVKRKSPEKVILSLPQYYLRLAISAYQSHIFNIIVQNLHMSEYPLLPETMIPLVGYSTDFSSLNEESRAFLKEQLNKDNLNLNSFKHKHKMLRTKGISRAAIIKPTNLDFTLPDSKKNVLQVVFNLTKGSYATMFLREVLRNNTVKRESQSG